MPEIRQSASDGMKILMSTHYFASHKGGIEIVAGELFRRIAERNARVVWLAGDATPPPDAVGDSRAIPLPVLNVVEEKTGLPFPIPGLRALRIIYQQVRKADIVILHDCLYLSNVVALLLARLRGVPTMIIQHARVGAMPYKQRIVTAIVRLANWVIARPMLSNADQVVFISETTRNFFSSVRTKAPSEVVFNGVDTERFRPADDREHAASLRNKFDLPLDRPAILFVGRFVEIKGLRPLRRMAELRPDITFVFCGWGPLDPEKWNAANVRVYRDLHGKSLADMYRACDMLVLPSVGEGFPLVIQEALASGLPVLCSTETVTAHPAMEEYVQAVPVSVGDDLETARAFCGAIDRVPDPYGEAKGNIEARRAFAESRYSWDRTTERYLEITAELVRRSANLPAQVSTENVPS